VTVNLTGDARLVDSVQVAALLRPQDQGTSSATPTRRAASPRCGSSRSQPATVRAIPTARSRGTPPASSRAPKFRERPRLGRTTAPDLQLAGFDVRDTQATHVQLRVLSNQCTGTPVYQGDPDADPANDPDCNENSPQGEIVRAAELQVFSR
jgi:hypothetical protein